MKLSLCRWGVLAALASAAIAGSAQAAQAAIRSTELPVEVFGRTSDCATEVSASNPGPCHLASFSATERGAGVSQPLLFVEFETVVYAPPPDFDNVTFLSDTVCVVQGGLWPLIRRAGQRIIVVARVNPGDCSGTPLPHAVTFVGVVTASEPLPTTAGSIPAAAFSVADGTVYRHSLFGAIFAPNPT
jgi:hypothetical protein